MYSKQYNAVAAEDFIDVIKGYLIAMVESWNSNHHPGIFSIVNSFDGNGESKYLSLRCPSILDSGVSISSSTSSLCQPHKLSIRTNTQKQHD